MYMFVVFYFWFRIFIVLYFIVVVIVFIVGMVVKMVVKGLFIDCIIDVKLLNLLFMCRCFDILCILERWKIFNYIKNVGLMFLDEYLGKMGW